MYWVIAYFVIGWLAVLVGICGSAIGRHGPLPVGPAIALFLLWPYLLPKGGWLAVQKIRKEKRDG